ncbi:MAG: hypothetical protein IR159_07960 [Brevundimonas sp.]|nr:hypothetical protein [Brevundimonas sp.]
MTDMVRAMNPMGAISNAGEAKAAARASAIAIFLGVIWGLVGLAWMMGPGAEMMEAAMAEAAAASPGAEGMAGMLAGAAVGFTGFLILCQVILGLVQWFKPNIVIPILFTVLVVYGLGTGVLALTMADQLGMGGTPQAPAWQTWGGMAVMVVQLILHVAGIRGASAMGKFRDAQAY